MNWTGLCQLARFPSALSTLWKGIEQWLVSWASDNHSEIPTTSWKWDFTVTQPCSLNTDKHSSLLNKHATASQWSSVEHSGFYQTNGKSTKWKELQFILSKKGHLSYQRKYRKYLTCLLAFLMITNLITQKASAHSQLHFNHLKLTFGFSMLGNTTAMFILNQQKPTWLNTPVTDLMKPNNYLVFSSIYCSVITIVHLKKKKTEYTCRVTNCFILERDTKLS